MNLRKSLQLNELLIKREGEFLRVQQCEKAIAGILDGQFPIPPPPELPSTRSKNKTASKSRVQTGDPPQRVRTLTAGETGYQIHYQQAEEQHTDATADRKVMQWLLRPQSDWKILRIETIDFAGEIQETLFQQP